MKVHDLTKPNFEAFEMVVDYFAPEDAGGVGGICSLINGREDADLPEHISMLEGRLTKEEHCVKKPKPKKRVRREYSKDDVKELRAHSKAKTPVSKIAKLTKRTVGSLRQKARSLGIGLGHQR